MHEANFTDEIVKAILEELRKYPDYRPKEVKVRVGEMLHLVQESVKMHYLTQTKGTPLEGVSLWLEELPVRVRCRMCHEEGGVEDHHLLMCAYCGSPEVDLVNGDEILIDSIQVER